MENKQPKLITTGDTLGEMKGYTLRVGKKKSPEMKSCFVGKVPDFGWWFVEGDFPDDTGPFSKLREIKEAWLEWLVSEAIEARETSTGSPMVSADARASYSDGDTLYPPKTTPEQSSTEQWKSWLKAETADIMTICHFAVENAEDEKILEAASRILEVIN